MKQKIKTLILYFGNKAKLGLKDTSYHEDWRLKKFMDTSSQSDSANAWVQSFYDGTQNIRNIIAGVAIRAIRYF